MRHFLRRNPPPFTRVLLVESGSRGIFDHLIPGLHELYPQMELDLVTCYAGAPQGFRGRLFNIADYAGSAGRKRLYAELRARNYTVTGIICAAEPIMTKWKWMIAAKVPAKLFVLNENGDYFWFDRAHLGVIAHFILFRAGLTGAAAVPTLVRLLMFPLSLAYLLTYAGFVHLRRKLRLSLGGST